MAEVTVKIDGKEVCVPAGTTILEAAGQADVHIPTLCYMKDCSPIGACRICMVEVEGMPRPAAACVTPVREGMVIHTHTAKIDAYRRETLSLICENHRMDCEFCPRYGNCELYALMTEYGLEDRPFNRTYRAPRVDDSDRVLKLDPSKCVGCRRCVTACREQGLNILGILKRGANAYAGPAEPLGDTACVHCGQCAAVCPTGAIYDQDDDLGLLMKALSYGDMRVAALVAPDTFAGIGAMFAVEVGTDNTEKLAAVLKKIGFSEVYSESEGRQIAAAGMLNELLDAGAKHKPLILADCPSAVQLVRRQYPALAPFLSGSRTDPRAAFAEAYRAKCAEEGKMGAEDVMVVSISDCTAAKTLEDAGIDFALTTRELMTLIRRTCVSRYTAVTVWKNTKGIPLDTLTGVPERYEEDLVSCLQNATTQNLKAVRAEGLADVKRALDEMAAGAYADLVSLAACPGGCAHGGGRIQWNNRNNFVYAKEEEAI